jgi:hypothetical protein
MKTIAVRVEQKHLDTGRKGSVHHCAVALALYEQHPPAPGMWWSVVGPQAYLYDDIGGEVIYQMPTFAHNRLMDFDSFRPVHPFTFELAVTE